MGGYWLIGEEEKYRLMLCIMYAEKCSVKLQFTAYYCNTKGSAVVEAGTQLKYCQLLRNSTQNPIENA